MIDKGVGQRSWPDGGEESLEIDIPYPSLQFAGGQKKTKNWEKENNVSLIVL